MTATDPADPVGHNALQWLFVIVVSLMAAPFAALKRLFHRTAGGR